MVKVKIRSEEVINNINLEGILVPLFDVKAKRDKKGKVQESIGYLEVSEEQAVKLKEIAEECGFRVTKG